MADSSLPAELRGSGLLELAFEYALEAHLNASEEPDLSHGLQTALILRRHGYPDELVCAGLLHDLIDSTAVFPHSLEQLFGPGIANPVLACSRRLVEEGLSSKERFLSSGRHAFALRAACGMASLRALRRSRSHTPSGHGAQDLEQELREDATLLERAGGRSDLVREFITAVAGEERLAVDQLVENE